MVNIEKEAYLNKISEYRNKLHFSAFLRYLFLELTLRCNERCLHCGSFCGDISSAELTLSQYQRFLDEIKGDFGTNNLMLCITGGEPLLREDFFQIMSYAHELGFSWGMTSNGTLIDDNIAQSLKRVGMSTISISLDGMADTHNQMRQIPKAWERAIRGIESLRKVEGFRNIQVTTVVTHKNIAQLDDVYNVVKNLGVDSWRVINIEPIGRALLNPEFLLTPDDYRYLFSYIIEQRKKGRVVSYGCSHFLGMDYEKEVRDWYFMCGAGSIIASVMANGDIAACLDIERRSELIQGNILKNRFKDIWDNKFQAFRRDLSEMCESCSSCSHVGYCHGDSFHSWDFDNNCPQVCFKDILF